MPRGSEPHRGTGGTGSTRKPPNDAQANAERVVEQVSPDGWSVEESLPSPDGWSVEPTLPPLTRTRRSDAVVQAVVVACLADGQPRSTEVENRREARNLVRRLVHAASRQGASVTTRTVERDGKLFVVAQITKEAE